MLVLVLELAVVSGAPSACVSSATSASTAVGVVGVVGVVGAVGVVGVVGAVGLCCLSGSFLTTEDDTDGELGRD